MAMRAADVPQKGWEDMKRFGWMLVPCVALLGCGGGVGNFVGTWSVISGSETATCGTQTVTGTPTGNNTIVEGTDSDIVLTDADGNHRGSARLLRSDGPHLLADHYAHLCPAGIPCGPAVREITRFCLDPALGAAARRKTRNQLVTELAEHALAHAITAYTGIATYAWFEQISRFGWACRKLGPSGDLRSRDLVALQITIDDQTRPGLIAGGIYDRAPRVLHRAGDLA